MFSYKSARELCELLKVLDGKDAKDAAVALLGISSDVFMNRESDSSYIFENFREVTYSLFDQLKVELPKFYSGGCFKIDIDYSVFDNLHESNISRNIYDIDMNSFLDALPRADLVLGISKGGLEAGIRSADWLDCDSFFGFYEYKHVKERKFTLIDYKIPEFFGKDILVVDNLVKNGRSMGAAFEYLISEGAGLVRGMALERLFNYDLSSFGTKVIGERDGFEVYGANSLD